MILSDRNRAELRNKDPGVEIVIIDEVLMVSESCSIKYISV